MNTANDGRLPAVFQARGKVAERLAFDPDDLLRDEERDEEMARGGVGTKPSRR